MIALSSYVQFIKAHERILILAVSGFLIFHIGDGALNGWIHHDETNAKIAALQVKTDDIQTVVLQAQVTTLQKQVASTNAALVAAIAQRNTQTKQQQTTDQTLPLPALAVRWELLAQLQPTDISTTDVSGQLTVNDAGSRATVQMLEDVPTLQANLKADQTIIDNDVLIIGKQGDLITELNKDLVDEKKSHVDDVNLEKVKGKRSFIRGFKIGAIVGAGAVIAFRVLVGHAI
jgi:hypothetical protein